MNKEKKIVLTELTIIIVLWSLTIISPLLFIGDFNHNWRAVHIMWVECALVGVLFIINRFLLMPRLFFTRKYKWYALCLATLFMLWGIFIIPFDGVNAILTLFLDNFPEYIMPMAMESHPYNNIHPHNMLPPRIEVNRLSAIPPNTSIFIFTIIAIALDIGLSIATRWVVWEQKQAEIENEKIQAQLSNLQNQVSPHFFMNTLNNIHALVDIDSERAKQTIIELSDLMDYLLYHSSNNKRVSLIREIDFIGNYINLMRLRFSKQVKINYSCNESTPHVEIPPLLFINFIENSFKYGVDYESDSFVSIKFEFTEDYITMIAINSNHAQIAKRGRGGLGIENSRKRLDLLYGKNYSLEIINKEMIHSVILKIPII